MLFNDRYVALLDESDCKHEVLIARQFFAKLFRQCDALNIVPAPQLGVIRSSHPMQMHLIPTSTRPDRKNVVTRQRATAIGWRNFRRIHRQFRISAEISFLTISIVLPKLDSREALDFVSQIQNLFYPFEFSSLLIPFSSVRTQSIRQI